MPKHEQKACPNKVAMMWVERTEQIEQMEQIQHLGQSGQVEQIGHM